MTKPPFTIIRGGKLVIVDKYTIPDFKQLGTGNAVRIENGKLILEIQLNKNLSAAALQSFLRGVKFATSSSGLKTATRSVNVTLTTGSEAASVVQQAINVTK